MFAFLRNLDRRWIFLLMFLAVAVPMLLGVTFPEKPSEMVESVFESVERLPNGSRVLMAFDYDPASKGELHPMAAAFTRHCAEKNHKLYFMTLWATGLPMLQANIDILQREYPHYEYGRDYVNLGYQPGSESVIKVLVSDFQKQLTADVHGTPIKEFPLTRDVKNIQQMNLIVSVTAGTPGTKEWVQYASAPYAIPTVAGSTGVGAPVLYPYIPRQLNGILGAIKAAAEYEQTIINAYPHIAKNDKAKQALRRMGPQLVAHVLIIGLIILGNTIYFMERSRGAAR